MTLMGKNGCPLCVIIIKENPNLYIAVFPHFIMQSKHQENFNYMTAPTKTKVFNCPMLNHLPKEIRTKYINKLEDHCKCCLMKTNKCICRNNMPTVGLCNSCSKSLYICGHIKTEQRIVERRRIYNELYQEAQRHYLPKDLVAPKLSQRTSTIYALFSKINSLLPHQWQQNTPMATIIPQDNEDLNLLCFRPQSEGH